MVPTRTNTAKIKHKVHRGKHENAQEATARHGPRCRAHALSCGGLLLYGFEGAGWLILARISHDEAYPGIEILPRSRNWWAWLKGTPPECVHLGEECDWIATLLPDTLYLRGKRSTKREPPR